MPIAGLRKINLPLRAIDNSNRERRFRLCPIRLRIISSGEPRNDVRERSCFIMFHWAQMQRLPRFNEARRRITTAIDETSEIFQRLGVISSGNSKWTSTTAAACCIWKRSLSRRCRVGKRKFQSRACWVSHLAAPSAPAHSCSSYALLNIKFTMRSSLKRTLSALPTFYPSNATWQSIEEWLDSIKNAGDSFGVGDLLNASIGAENNAAIWSLDGDFNRVARLNLISLYQP